MDQELLVASQQAAWAAQSAAEAAWWALLFNGLAVAVTGGAFWFAARQYFKAAQFDRFRATAALTRFLELVEPIAESTAHDEDGMICADTAWPAVSNGLFERALERLPLISLDHVPDHDIVNYAETLPMILTQLKEQWMGLQWANARVPANTPQVVYIREATDYARALRKAIRSGARRDWKALAHFKTIC